MRFSFIENEDAILRPDGVKITFENIEDMTATQIAQHAADSSCDIIKAVAQRNAKPKLEPGCFDHSKLSFNDPFVSDVLDASKTAWAEYMEEALSNKAMPLNFREHANILVGDILEKRIGIDEEFIPGLEDAQEELMDFQEATLQLILKHKGGGLGKLSKPTSALKRHLKKVMVATGRGDAYSALSKDLKVFIYYVLGEEQITYYECDEKYYLCENDFLLEALDFLKVSPSDFYDAYLKRWGNADGIYNLCGMVKEYKEGPLVKVGGDDEHERSLVNVFESQTGQSTSVAFVAKVALRDVLYRPRFNTSKLKIEGGALINFDLSNAGKVATTTKPVSIPSVSDKLNILLHTDSFLSNLIPNELTARNKVVFDESNSLTMQEARKVTKGMRPNYPQIIICMNESELTDEHIYLLAHRTSSALERANLFEASEEAKSIAEASSIEDCIKSLSKMGKLLIGKSEAA